MLNTIKKLYHKIFAIKQLSEADYTELILQKIRSAGGTAGKNISIYNSFIDMSEPYLLSIGDDVTITHATILTHDACLYKKTGFTKIQRTEIGNNVFVGYGAIILSGTKIGDNVIIGAGSVVAKSIPDNSIVIGNPCRIISTYDEFLQRELILMKSSVVVDMLPTEIMNNKDIIEKLRRAEGGYIK